MPRSSTNPLRTHDYFCSACGHEAPNVRLRWPERPLCCNQPMDYHPPNVHMDAFEPIPGGEFETTDTFGNRVTVESFHQIREIERQSEIAYRNGEGQLLRWRDLSMDKGNRDQSSIAKHIDRPMDMQDGPRIEADPSMVSSHPVEGDVDSAEDVPFSAGDVIGDGGD